MINQLSGSGQKVRWRIGILKDSLLYRNLSEKINDTGQMIPVEPQVLLAGDQMLDALIAGYEDASRVPELYHTPVILIATEEQQHLLPPFLSTAFVPVRSPTPSSVSGLEDCLQIDTDILKQELQRTLEKVRYVRTAQDVFGDALKVDVHALQDSLTREGGINSLFDAYHGLCKEFVSDIIDCAKSSTDKETVDRARDQLSRFAYVIDDHALRKELFAQAERVGETKLISNFMKDTRLIPAVITHFFPTVEEAPVGYDRIENRHLVFHSPALPDYGFKYAKDQRASLQHERLVLSKFHKYLPRINQQFKDRNPPFVSIPEVLGHGPDNPDEAGWYGLAFKWLPGKELLLYLFDLQKEVRSNLPGTEKHEKADADLLRIKKMVIDQVARVTALAYVVSKLEEGEHGLVSQTFSRDPIAYLEKLKGRFIGDSYGDIEYRGLSGGVRKAFGERHEDKVRDLEDMVVQNMLPVASIIARSSPGIDTDRSLPNLLIEPGERMRIHNVDFETLKNDTIIQSWVNAALLLDDYSNGRTPMEKDVSYKDALLFKKDEQVPWHLYSLFEFLNTFKDYVGEIKHALGRREDAKNIKVFLPDADRAYAEFYSLSLYRGLFYCGYFERFRDVRKHPIKHPIELLDFNQHLVVKNARSSLADLTKTHQFTRPESESLGTLNKGLTEVYARIKTRMGSHDNQEA